MAHSVVKLGPSKWLAVVCSLFALVTGAVTFWGGYVWFKCDFTSEETSRHCSGEGVVLLLPKSSSCAEC